MKAKSLILHMLVVFITLLIGTSAFAVIPSDKTIYKLAISTKKADEIFEREMIKQTEEWSFLHRSIGRPLLRKRGKIIYKSIAVERLSDNKLKLAIGGQPDFIGTINGWTNWVDAAGTKFRVHLKVTDHTIVRKMVNDEGEQRLTYVFSKDGSRVNFTILMDSDQIDNPIAFTLPYKK